MSGSCRQVRLPQYDAMTQVDSLLSNCVSKSKRRTVGGFGPGSVLTLFFQAESQLRNMFKPTFCSDSSRMILDVFDFTPCCFLLQFGHLPQKPYHNHTRQGNVSCLEDLSIRTIWVWSVEVLLQQFKSCAYVTSLQKCSPLSQDELRRSS